MNWDVQFITNHQPITPCPTTYHPPNHHQEVSLLSVPGCMPCIQPQVAENPPTQDASHPPGWHDMFLGNRESLWINLDLPLSHGWNRIQWYISNKTHHRVDLLHLQKTWGKVGKVLLLFRYDMLPKHSNIGSLEQECRYNTAKVMSHQK